MKTALLEEAVRIADAANDVQRGFDARIELINSSNLGGSDDKMLVAFAWCLQRFDEDPDISDVYTIMWYFKWVLGHISEFARMTREQIAGLDQDYERRLKQYNYSLAPLYKLRFEISIDLGDDRSTQQQWFDLWQSTSRDEMQDCRACETNALGAAYEHFGDLERRVSTVRPILEGRMSCLTVPETTYANVLKALVSLGRDEQAAELHRTGYRRVARREAFLRSVAEHLTYLVRIGNADKASRVFQDHLPMVLDEPNDLTRVCFLISSVCFLRHLAVVSKRPRKLAIPARAGCHREDSRYDPGELADFFEAEVTALVGQFNQRNGNDAWNSRLPEALEFVGLQ